MATISPVVVSSIANACWRACKSHPIIRISASFGPSTVRVNTETVYSDRREAGVVMASIGNGPRTPNGPLDSSLFIRLLCHRGLIRRHHEFTHCIHENGTARNSEPLGLTR